MAVMQATKVIGLVLLVTAAVSMGADVAMADTVYIRDTLYVPLRGGQSIEHRILHRGLRSGTAVERLEEDEDWTRVRTEDGLEGWLQSQYLVEEPIAQTRLDDLQSQLEELEAQHQQTLLRLHETNEANEALTVAESDATEKNAELTDELTRINELAANVIAIDEENKQLNESQEELLSRIDALNAENESLSDDSAQQWFLRGAGTVLIGLLFGFWIGRRIYHRRNTSGWA